MVVAMTHEHTGALAVAQRKVLDSQPALFRTHGLGVEADQARVVGGPVGGMAGKARGPQAPRQGIALDVQPVALEEVAASFVMALAEIVLEVCNFKPLRSARTLTCFLTMWNIPGSVVYIHRGTTSLYSSLRYF